MVMILSFVWKMCACWSLSFRNDINAIQFLFWSFKQVKKWGFPDFYLIKALQIEYIVPENTAFWGFNAESISSAGHFFKSCQKLGFYEKFIVSKHDFWNLWARPCSSLSQCLSLRKALKPLLSYLQKIQRT